MKKIAIALAIASTLLFGSTATFAQCGNMGGKSMGKHSRMHGKRRHRRHGRRKHMMPKTNANSAMTNNANR